MIISMATINGYAKCLQGSSDDYDYTLFNFEYGCIAFTPQYAIYINIK